MEYYFCSIRGIINAMATDQLILKHVSGNGKKVNLYGRQLVFTHIHKAAGTTLSWIADGIAKHRSEETIRLRGTIYGQHVGTNYTEAIDSLRATPPDTLAAASFVSGHLATSAWDEAPVKKPPTFITILRDPVERMISHFQFVNIRNEWPSIVPLDDLVRDGVLVDNLQVRQISGCLDPSEPCTEGMLERALITLDERYALVGLTESFDEMLGTLISSCGWPDIIYSDYQTKKINTEIAKKKLVLDDHQMAILSKECSIHNHFDQLMIEEVKGRGDVLVNPRNRDQPPKVDDSVVVVSPMIRTNNDDFPVFPKKELISFYEWVGQNNNVHLKTI